MKRRFARIPPRRPIFLGCEGLSEVGYATLIARIARELPGVHVHIHVERLQPGAGDPLQLVRRAIQKSADLSRRRSEFSVKAVLLDEGSAEKMRQAVSTAQEAGIQHLIWQKPDHEALLLRHLEGCQDRRPPMGQSLAALRQQWPEYEKGMSAQCLRTRIMLEGVRRASAAEPELRAFLLEIGLIAP